MRLGLHVEVAGGFRPAVEYAKRLDCTAVQIFSGNPKTYRITPADRPALEAFDADRRAAGIATVAIHTSYLINLASDDPKIAANSLRLLRNDLAVAALGRMEVVNTHLGSYGKRDRDEGFVQVCRMLEEALADIDPGVVLVMENSAGAGQLCGGTIEELGALVRTVGHPQLGVCIDTAHSWAAGYAIDTQPGVDAFLELIEREIGLRG